MITGPWDVYVVEYARARAQPAASLVHGDGGRPPLDVPYAFVVARSAHGVVLIDTGFLADSGGGQRMAATYGVQEWVHPLRLLATLGLSASDITHVVLTHAHFDHMGAIRLFPGAHITMQKRELLCCIEALALPPQFGFMCDGVDPDDLHGAISAASQHRLTLLDSDKIDLLPGLDACLAADSHTPGSQFVALATPGGRVVVAGDCVYSYRNLALGRDDGQHRPLGSALGSAWGQLHAMQRISEAAGGDKSRIILLHDTERWAQGSVVAEVDGMRVVRVVPPLPGSASLPYANGNCGRERGP